MVEFPNALSPVRLRSWKAGNLSDLGSDSGSVSGSRSEVIY